MIHNESKYEHTNKNIRKESFQVDRVFSEYSKFITYFTIKMPMVLWKHEQLEDRKMTNEEYTLLSIGNFCLLLTV